MATSNNPLAPNPETDIDNPEVHQHRVPIVNIEQEEDRRAPVPAGEEGNVEYDGERGSVESVPDSEL